MSPATKLETGIAKTGSGGQMPKSEEGELSSSPIQAENKPPRSTPRSSSKTTASEADAQFPRYPTTRNYSIPQRRTGSNLVTLGTRIANGPAPQKGTPQDRFRQAMLGIDEASKPAATMPQACFGLSSAPPATCAAPEAGAFWGAYPPNIAARTGDVGYGRLVPPTPVSSTSVPASSPWGATPLWNNASHLHVAQEQWQNPQHPPQSQRSDYSRNGQVPTALLSQECQARRFNPEFNETVTTDGHFMCSVRLKDTEISSPWAYDTAIDAKYAIANQGLRIVRGWAKPTPAELKRLQSISEADRMRASGTQPSQIDDKLRRITNARENLRNRCRKEAGREVGKETFSPTDRETGAPATAPSSVNMDNPIEARAFLEGFELGRRLAAAEEKRDKERGGRRRSRSPVRELSRDNGAYRRRSRSRDRHRTRRAGSVPYGCHRAESRDSTVPGADRYRPRSSEGIGGKRITRSPGEDDGRHSPKKH